MLTFNNTLLDVYSPVNIVSSSVLFSVIFSIMMSARVRRNGGSLFMKTSRAFSSSSFSSCNWLYRCYKLICLGRVTRGKLLYLQQNHNNLPHPKLLIPPLPRFLTEIRHFSYHSREKFLDELTGHYYK